jgi:large subunit ribosomal protein L25
MDKIKLKVNQRIETAKAVGALRRAGNMPAVLYGKGKENQNLTVSVHDFEKMYREAGTSSIVLLEIEGNGNKNVLVQDVAYDAYTSKPEHADFYEVSMTEKITTSIPLVFIGDSAAVIDMDGTLSTNKDEIEIECLPADLPHNIEVDVSVLVDFEQAIHVSDLMVPTGVEIKDDPEEIEMPESETGAEETAGGEEGEKTEKEADSPEKSE